MCPLKRGVRLRGVSVNKGSIVVVTKLMLELLNAKQMYDSPSKELHSQDKQIRELCRKSKTRVMDGVIFSFIMLHINLCTFTNLVN